MINLAVIEMKDIIKYLVRITIIITIVVALTRYFYGFRTKIQNKAEEIKEYTFLSCLDTAVPSIKSVNYPKDSNSEDYSMEPLKMALKVELGMVERIEIKKDTEQIIEESKKEDNSKIEEEENIQEAKEDVQTEVLKNNVPETYTTTYNTVKIKNGTKIKLTEEILTPDVTINTKNILIYHTHTCESYTPSEKYTYTKSGNFRTTDITRSVVRVGTELEKYMKNYGYNVIHDQTLYDYPSYNGSYDRSLSNVGKLLDKNPGTEVLFDIHRDAIADSTYAPTVKIGDEYAAQLLFVIGSNGGGQHDNWQQNLKFAIKIQEKANELYPGLFKPIILRNSRYNQQLAKGASIIEVGATGNTLDQCLVSMKYLAKVLSEI